MSEYPYSHVSSKIKDFLDKIPSTGTPDKVTYNELAARGFKSTNDRSILGVLKYLNLVDSEGVPTENWNLYRNRSNNKALLATLIRNAYSELFVMYPEAQERTDEEIRNFIASKTKVGEDSIQRIVTTFKTLCGMAVFDTPQPQANVQTEKQVLRQEPIVDDVDGSMPAREPVENIALPIRPTLHPIHIDIHIHLSAASDVQATDALIKSLARHILGRKVEDES